MTRISTLILFAALALFAPVTAFAQLVPPAGSAGAGSSAISGIPFGPANPRVLSDPSGIGNASSMPPLTPNRPAPPTTYGAVDTVSPRARVVTPPYAGASQRIVGPRKAQSRKPPARKRSRPEVSSFTGICRGC
jgi:hypothetical protein